MGEVILDFKVKVALQEFEGEREKFNLSERRSPCRPKKLRASTIDVLTLGISLGQVTEERKK